MGRVRQTPGAWRTVFAMIVLAGCVLPFVDLSRSPHASGVNPKARGKIERFRGGTYEPKQRFDKPQEAHDFWARKRKDASGKVPVARYLTVREHAKRMPGGALGPPLPASLQKNMPAFRSGRTFSAPGGAAGLAAPPRLAAWAGLGPGNIGGRTRALVVLPGNVLYAAGVAGGVWKSTDDGLSWTALTDFLPNIAVTTLAVDPVDSNRLYAGTGEGYFNFDAVRGAGIFVTTNAGSTWSQLGSTANSNFHFVNKLIVSPNSSSVLYAATRTGVWRSTDQGASWSQRLAGEIFEMAVRNAGGIDHVFVWKKQDTVYRSTDGGATFAASGTGIPAGKWRGSLAVPAGDRAYCAVADSASSSFGRLVGVYQSTDNGASWTRRDTTGASAQGRLNSLLFSNPLFGADLDGDGTNDCFGGSPQLFDQGWYDNVIASHPSNPDRVWLGGIDLFRSDDGGATWGIASYWYKQPGNVNYNHADHHAIVFHPSYDDTVNTTVYFGNDGGVHKTLNGTAAVATAGYSTTAICGNEFGATGLLPLVNFTGLQNGYGVTQFYHGAVSATGSTVIGGTQDNGTLKAPASGTSWTSIRGGDGGYCAIDATNPNVLYLENFGLSLRKSTDGGASSSPAVSGITESGANFLFITPFAMDPSDSQRLWIGGRQPWRTVNGATSWTAANSVVLTADSISAWGIARSAAGNVVYLGSEGGEVWRSGDALAASPSWTRIDGGLPDAYVSSIGVHPTNPNIVYVTFSSFGTPGGQVYRTNDASQGGSTTWTPVIGSGGSAIPDIPVHCVFVHPTDPNILVVGTDAGVMASSDAGESWGNVNGTSMPNTVVEHLAFQAPDQLFAFTHGRGVFRTTVAPALVTVASPNGGERVNPAGNLNVTWTVNTGASDAGQITAFDVALALDGTTFGPIATGLASTARSFAYTIPGGTRAAMARVRVTARGASGNLDADEGDGTFAINGLPTANAGADRIVLPSAAVSLGGAGSDPDGDPITYAWGQTAGPARTLSSTTIANPSFTARSNRGDAYDFQLSVDDGVEVAQDTVTVRVNRLPVPTATGARVLPGATARLDSAGSSDPDGSPLTRLWTQIGTPAVTLSDPAAVAPTFATGTTRGTTYTFQLRVDDGTEQATTTTTVTVNSVPLANAGAPQRVPPGALVTLHGEGSTDPDFDPLTFSWTASGVSLTGANTKNPTFFAPPTRGVSSTFQVVVNDGLESASAGTFVAVNRLPVAQATVPGRVKPGDRVVLDASRSSDPDGDALTYLWTQSGPSSVTIDATAAAPAFTAPATRGVSFTFTLAVSDGVEQSLIPNRVVQVNRAPAVVAVAPSVVVPGASVELDGSRSTDGDGDTLAYAWTQTAGPAVTFDATSARPRFTAPSARGQVVGFQLLVSDPVESGSAQAAVAVNQLPLPRALLPARLKPGASITLDGAASVDPEGATLTYSWTQLRGPKVELAPTAPRPVFTAPTTRGEELVFQLEVSDGLEKATATFATKVNKPPVAKPAKLVSGAPDTRVPLSAGDSTDPDGDELTYRWKQVGGPDVVYTETGPEIQVDLSGLARGTELTFEVDASDGQESNVATTKLRVNHAPDAGKPRSERALPGSSFSMRADASDVDGDKLTYRWTQTAGPPVAFDAGSRTLAFTTPAVGRQSLGFELAVTDGVETATTITTVELEDRAYATELGGAGAGGCRAGRDGEPGGDHALTFMFLGAAVLLLRRAGSPGRPDRAAGS